MRFWPGAGAIERELEAGKRALPPRNGADCGSYCGHARAGPVGLSDGASLFAPPPCLASASDLVESCATKATEGLPMEIVPLRPGFAAELRGVTLAAPAADEGAYDEVRAVFEQHSVIVFRDQEVTDEGQLAFSRRIRPLEVTKVGSLGAGTNLLIPRTIHANRNLVPADHRLGPRNKAHQ